MSWSLNSGSIRKLIYSTWHELITIYDRERGYCIINKRMEVVVPWGVYHYIDGYDRGLCRVCEKQRQGKYIVYRWGIINEKGEVVLPIKYLEVRDFYDKGRDYTMVRKENGELEKIYLNALRSARYLPDYFESPFLSDEERYGKIDVDPMLQSDSTLTEEECGYWDGESYEQDW